MRIFDIGFGATLMGLCAVVGCGSTSASPGADASADGGNSAARDGEAIAEEGGAGQDAEAGLDGSTAGDASCHLECPATPPQAGEACATAPATCEYPRDAGAGCVSAFDCISGEFQSSVDCQAAPSAGCPASLEQVPLGQTCATASGACAYPWNVCDCLGPPANDGGAGTWQCFPVPSTCPSLPPFLGTSCAPTTAVCAYGRNMCAARDLGFFECPCGAWQAIPPPPCVPPG
jgi:hypothetical protein